MTLLDLFKKYSADELLATIDEMFPDTEKFHNTFREAYNLMHYCPRKSVNICLNTL